LLLLLPIVPAITRTTISTAIVIRTMRFCCIPA
jgi:hypothetical protein